MQTEFLESSIHDFTNFLLSGYQNLLRKNRIVDFGGKRFDIGKKKLDFFPYSHILDGRISKYMHYTIVRLAWNVKKGFNLNVNLGFCHNYIKIENHSLQLAPPKNYYCLKTFNSLQYTTLNSYNKTEMLNIIKEDHSPNVKLLLRQTHIIP